MQTAGGGFAAAATAQDQIVDYKVTITFPSGVQSSYSDVTKSVVSVDVQRSVTSNLPDGTSLISGYPSASATVVLSGFLNQAAGVALVEAQSIYWLMNPNDPTSPMYRTTRGGLPIVIQAGLWDGATTADLVTIFTGTIDQVACSEGTVTLTCRDNRSTITNQATLPPVITQAPYNAGLTSTYAVDYLLRHSSPAQYLSWPALHPNVLFAASYESSIWPEVGTLYNHYSQSPTFAPGFHGTGLGACNDALVVSTMTASILTTDKINMHFLASGDFDINVQDDPSTYEVIVQRYSGGSAIQIGAITPSGEHVQGYSVSTGSHEFEVSLTWPAGSTTISGTLWVDGAAQAVSVSALDARPTGKSFITVAAVGDDTGGLRGLQVTNEATYTSRYPFTPTLILDPAGSLNSLTALPDVSGQDVWSALQDIASAESAVIGFDELGLCHFTNRQTIETGTSVRTVTSTASLATLDSLEQMSLCATHIQVPVNQISIGPLGFVWTATSILTANPGVPLVLVINTGSPVVNVPTTDSGFYFAASVGGTPIVGQTYWQASRTSDGNSAWGTGISIATQQLSSTQLLVTITNSNSFDMFLMTPNLYPGPNAAPTGTPGLFIGGQAITAASIAASSTDLTGAVIVDEQWPPAGSGGAVSNTQFGDISLQLSTNDWLQDVPTAQGLAGDLLSDLHYPIPLLRNVSIVADPRLQLLDPITIIDTDVSMINDLSILVGIETSFSASEWTQSIDARPLWPPGAWVLGLAGQSELGTTTYLY